MRRFTTSPDKPIRVQGLNQLLSIILFMAAFSCSYPKMVCKAEQYSYAYIGTIPIRVDNNYTHPDIELVDSSALFTDNDEITAHLDSFLTGGYKVKYMQASNNHILLVLQTEDQFDSDLNDYRISESPVLPPKTTFDFYHYANSVNVIVPYSSTCQTDEEKEQNENEPSYLELTFEEATPFSWVLTSYSDLYTYVAIDFDGKGVFCFNDANFAAEDFVWFARIDIALETIDISELVSIGDEYNAVVYYRPSLSDDYDER